MAILTILAIMAHLDMATKMAIMGVYGKNRLGDVFNHVWIRRDSKEK